MRRETTFSAMADGAEFWWGHGYDSHFLAPANTKVSANSWKTADSPNVLPALQDDDVTWLDAPDEAPAEPARIRYVANIAQIDNLWHQYRDDEHKLFTDEEWATYKAMFKRGPNFPDWLRANLPTHAHSEEATCSPKSI